MILIPKLRLYKLALLAFMDLYLHCANKFQSSNTGWALTKITLKTCRNACKLLKKRMPTWRTELTTLRTEVGHVIFVLSMCPKRVKAVMWSSFWISWFRFFSAEINSLLHRLLRWPIALLYLVLDPGLLPDQFWSRPILHFQDKVKILRLAREKKELFYKGSRMHIYPDFSAGLIKKHQQFDVVKKKLRVADIKYSLLYPCTLRVISVSSPWLLYSPLCK